MLRDQNGRRAGRAEKSPRVERRQSGRVLPGDGALVRLVRKYAQMIDGVSLGTVEVGDRMVLSRRDAEILIAEGWAERTADRRRIPQLPRYAMATDASRRRKPKR